jgi:hypothetical protein
MGASSAELAPPNLLIAVFANKRFGRSGVLGSAPYGPLGNAWICPTQSTVLVASS